MSYTLKPITSNLIHLALIWCRWLHLIQDSFNSHTTLSQLTIKCNSEDIFQISFHSSSKCSTPATRITILVEWVKIKLSLTTTLTFRCNRMLISIYHTISRCTTSITRGTHSNISHQVIKLGWMYKIELIIKKMIIRTRKAGQNLEATRVILNFSISRIVTTKGIRISTWIQNISSLIQIIILIQEILIWVMISLTWNWTITISSTWIPIVFSSQYSLLSLWIPIKIFRKWA